MSIHFGFAELLHLLPSDPIPIVMFPRHVSGMAAMRLPVAGCGALPGVSTQEQQEFFALLIPPCHKDGIFSFSFL